MPYSISSAPMGATSVGVMGPLPLPDCERMNVPAADARRNSMKFVAEQLNRAGRYHWMGLRAYYCAVPLLFWLFGPHFMVVATMVVVAILYYLDRTPGEETT